MALGPPQSDIKRAPAAVARMGRLKARYMLAELRFVQPFGHEPSQATLALGRVEMGIARDIVETTEELATEIDRVECNEDGHEYLRQKLRQKVHEETALLDWIGEEEDKSLRRSVKRHMLEDDERCEFDDMRSGHISSGAVELVVHSGPAVVAVSSSSCAPIEGRRARGVRASTRGRFAR
jgi:hypothetical protein